MDPDARMKNRKKNWKEELLLLILLCRQHPVKMVCAGICPKASSQGCHQISEFRDNQGTFFSIRENQGGKKDILKNQGKSGKL